MKIFAVICVFVPLLILSVVGELSAQTPEELLKKGIAQYNDLEFEKAITTLKAAIDAGLPENDRIEAYKYLAFCYLVDDRTDEAKSAFLEILRIDYEYQLTGDIAPKIKQLFDETRRTYSPPDGSIFVKSSPENARIYLDDKLTGQNTPSVLQSVEPGQHMVKLELGGYETIQKPVKVMPGKVTEITLALNQVKATGTIQVDSTPAGATIFLNDVQLTQKTPALLSNVSTGAQTVRLSLEGYQTWQQVVTVEPQQTVTLNATLTREIPSRPRIPLKPRKKAIPKGFLGVHLGPYRPVDEVIAEVYSYPWAVAGLEAGVALGSSGIYAAGSISYAQKNGIAGITTWQQLFLRFGVRYMYFIGQSDDAMMIIEAMFLRSGIQVNVKDSTADVKKILEDAKTNKSGLALGLGIRLKIFEVKTVADFIRKNDKWLGGYNFTAGISMGF